MAAGVWVSHFTRAQPRGKLWRRPSGSLRPETPGMATALRPHGAKGASTGSWGRDSWTGTAVWAELGWGVGRSRSPSRRNGGPKAWALSLLPPARVQGSPKPCDSPLSTRRSPCPSRIIFAKWEPSFDFTPPVTGVGELRGRFRHSMKQSLQRSKRLPGNEHPVTSGMEATSD